MESTLIDKARMVIAETCLGVDYSKTPPIYIPIKDNKIKVSTNIDSLENADECMLLLPYIWNNTVPSYSGYGTVTFRNTLYKLLSIDNEGNVMVCYGNDSSLWIFGYSTGWGMNVHLELHIGRTTLYKSKNILRAEEDIYKIWDIYQASKKIMDIMEESFDYERAELQSKIDELTNKCSDLKKKNKVLRATIKKTKEKSV